jgi:hypothetical protein
VRRPHCVYSYWRAFTLNGDPSFFADALQVEVGPRAGTGSWGPKLESYDERFGNVLVTYGGHDEQLSIGSRPRSTTSGSASSSAW